MSRADISDRMTDALVRWSSTPRSWIDTHIRSPGDRLSGSPIAVVSALRAEFVIADEPTSALDVTVQAEVIEVLRELRDRHGTGLLFISHDLAVISELADRIVVMRKVKSSKVELLPKCLARRPTSTPDSCSPPCPASAKGAHRDGVTRSCEPAAGVWRDDGGR